MSALIDEGFHVFLDNVYFSRRKKKKQLKAKLSEPKRVKLLLERLGSTFIKLGQLLSMRPDLIPQEYCTELSNLQDNVTPFSYDVFIKELEKSLGKPVKSIFTHVSKKPLSAASIAQVHQATLKNGKRVVVKLKRPGIDI
ncbi:MAG TPA: AarF/ABC1/UbiB kinase family protein [Candidatus Woesearchaeota archaeon]|nr:AarF/ABC1/UbiB kinase family protein [Candidatus Woesearchaeota archaeon]